MGPPPTVPATARPHTDTPLPVSCETTAVTGLGTASRPANTSHVDVEDVPGVPHPLRRRKTKSGAVDDTSDNQPPESVRIREKDTPVPPTVPRPAGAPTTSATLKRRDTASPLPSSAPSDADLVLQTAVPAPEDMPDFGPLPAGPAACLSGPDAVHPHARTPAMAMYDKREKIGEGMNE